MRFRSVKRKEGGVVYWVVQIKRKWWHLWENTPYKYCRTKDRAQRLCGKFEYHGYWD